MSRRLCAAALVAVAVVSGGSAFAKPGEEQLSEIELKVQEGDGYGKQYFAGRRAADAAAAEDASARLIKARNDAIQLILRAYVDKAGMPLLAPTPASWPREKMNPKAKTEMVNFEPLFLWTSPSTVEDLRKEEIAHTAPSGTVYLGERAFENPVANIAALILREGVRFARIPERSKRLKAISKATGWSLEAAAAEEVDDEAIDSMQAVIDAAGGLGIYPLDVLSLKLRQNQKRQTKSLRRIGNGDNAAQATLKEQKDEELELARAMQKTAYEDLQAELSPKERVRIEDLARQARAVTGDPEPSKRPRRPSRPPLELGTWVVNFRLGPSFGLKQLDVQGVIGLDAGYRVLRGGYVTLGVQGQFQGETELFPGAVDLMGRSLRTAFGFLMIPAGFEYDYALPARGLYLYGHLSVGYAAALNKFGATHFGFVTPEAGLKYLINPRVHLGVDILSLPIFFNRDNVLAAYRLLLYAGASF